MLNKIVLYCFWFIAIELTKCGVCAARQRFETMARLAFEHGMRVNELASCETPKPQLIYFKDPDKVYLPRATLLHRCGDATGCCPHSTQTCVALETKTVDLYFYTIVLKANHLNPRKVQQMQNIDRIGLTNHTRCGCRFIPALNTHNTNLIYDDIAPDYRPGVESQHHYHNNNLTNFLK